MGGGPTTNQCQWEKLDYDYIWSCNHFYRHPKLKDMSTNPCAKDSMFSKIDGNFVNNIKIEPLEDAEGIDDIELEMETKEFGNNG